MNARLAALADALALITVGDPLLPIEVDACRSASAILRALAEQKPVAWMAHYKRKGQRMHFTTTDYALAVENDGAGTPLALYTHLKEAE